MHDIPVQSEVRSVAYSTIFKSDFSILVDIIFENV